MKTILHSTDPSPILVVDDDKDDQFFLKEALLHTIPRALVQSLYDGAEAIQYLIKCIIPPDLIFLDLNMPRKNGEECLIEIKKDPKLKDIPVIIYSTSFREDIADELYKNGAHYYMQKRDFPELAESIQQVLSLLAENPHQPPRDKFIFTLSKV